MVTNDKGNKYIPIVLSFILGFIMIAQLFIIAGHNRSNQEFDIGDYSNYDLAVIEHQYLKSPTNENLLILIKVLCYEAEVNNKGCSDLIKKYGTELFSRAKRNEINLDKIDDEDIMLQIVSVLRKHGAS